MISISWGEPRPLRQRTDAILFPLDALRTGVHDDTGNPSNLFHQHGNGLKITALTSSTRR